MTQAYSEDLRSRALARADRGETIRSIAAALQISPSCVSKWKKLRRETGELEARQDEWAQEARAVRGPCPMAP